MSEEALVRPGVVFWVFILVKIDVALRDMLRHLLCRIIQILVAHLVPLNLQGPVSHFLGLFQPQQARELYFTRLNHCLKITQLRRLSHAHAKIEALLALVFHAWVVEQEGDRQGVKEGALLGKGVGMRHLHIRYYDTFVQFEFALLSRFLHEPGQPHRQRSYSHQTAIGARILTQQLSHLLHIIGPRLPILLLKLQINFLHRATELPEGALYRIADVKGVAFVPIPVPVGQEVLVQAVVARKPGTIRVLLSDLTHISFISRNFQLNVQV